ncbi:MAG TPA: histidine kinase dimerization/phosphoacceptor domain -containing protein, partial [Agriterribacter sp.]|nr:histidine kinase dimerization/phosphoacceptor domain -containing protein [Agriterribacter sp.]
MNTVYSGSDHKRLADDLFHQGIRYKNTGSDSLLWYANRLILLGEERVDDRVIINGMLLKANYEWRTGNHIAAMNVAMNALQKAEDNKFTEVVPVLYGIIGNLHKENENYPLALQAAEQGIRAAILIKDTTELIRIMLNRAMFIHSYGMRKNDPELRKEGLYKYLEGLKIAESSPAYEQLRISYYNNISQYYKIARDYPKGLLYGEKAEALAKKHHRYLSLTYTYNWLGEIYFYSGDQARGLRYLHQALDITIAQNAPFRTAEIYRALYGCYHYAGDDKKALEAFSRSVMINDSLQVLRNTKQIGRLQIEYETGKKDQRIASLRLINLEKTRTTKAITVGMILFVLLSAFLYFQYRGIRQRNRLLADSNKKINEQSEQLRFLMKELHHRVKNNLQIVSSLLSLQSNHMPDKDAQQAVKIGQQRIEAMSLIHRNLYQQNNPNMVNMKEYVTDLVESILQSFGMDKDKFNLQLDIQVTEMDVDKALPLGLIINEWVTNAFKYAYKETAYPSLMLSLKKSRAVILEIKDNGPGMTREAWEKPRGSFGVKLVKVLSKQLNGTC